MAIYVGVDLRRDCFTVCVRSEAGRTQTRDWKLKELTAFTTSRRANGWMSTESPPDDPLRLVG